MRKRTRQPEQNGMLMPDSKQKFIIESNTSYLTLAEFFKKTSA